MYYASNFSELKSLNISRLGIFGGTFDPPHLGHERVLDGLIAGEFFSHVLVMPAGRNPLKAGQNLFTDEARLKMLKLLCGRFDNVILSDWEINQSAETQSASYSYDTLLALKQTLGKQLPMTLILGSDVYSQFSQFYKAREIVKLVNLMVVERPGSEFNLDFNLPAQHIEIEDLPELSASEVREMILNEQDEWTEFLNPMIAKFIQEGKGIQF
jgi:nicotinate-nucleotide adenylyltransferase